MEVYLHRRFHKSYQKLTPKFQRKVSEAITRFKLNPHDSSLRNHPLHGDMQGRRSFIVTGDVRVIFREVDDYQFVTLLDVGTHNQVYQ